KNVLTPTDKPGTCTDPKGTFTACTENPVSVPTSVTLHKRVENVNATEPSPAKGWTLGLKAGKGTLTPEKATQVTGEDGNTRWTLKHQGVDNADLTVSEENQTGYEFKNLTCTVTHPNTNGGKPVTTTVTTSASGLTQAGSLAGVAPGSTVDCVFTNTHKSGSLTWSKVDTSAPANLLAGSEWELKGPDGGVTKIVDCQEAAKADCKGPDRDPVAGQFTLTGLPWGEYSLTETKAPAGYTRDGKTRTVIIAGDALVRSYGQIANEKRAPLTIPLTGGTGTLAFIVAGGAAL
ncbi:SpaA isopeptide-forming pilin-related protein, partial [Timonella senegalensis]|uniref:SpaA isopeptide-forming pilin-related protein n=1 Tax=Timonella senegalensis TaxID=1465825 RepID=UPI002FE07DBE